MLPLGQWLQTGMARNSTLLAQRGMASVALGHHLHVYVCTWVGFIVSLRHASWLVVSYDVPIDTSGPVDTLVSYDVHYSQEPTSKSRFV